MALTRDELEMWLQKFEEDGKSRNGSVSIQARAMAAVFAELIELKRENEGLKRSVDILVTKVYRAGL